MTDEPVKYGVGMFVADDVVRFNPPDLATLVVGQAMRAMRPETPTERDERIAREEQYNRKQQAKLAKWQAWHNSVAISAASTILRDVVRLHAPENVYGGVAGCTGCPGDYEYGAADWPCATLELIADRLGVEWVDET